MADQMARMMEWQPRSYRELMEEWPYTSMTILVHRVVHSIRERDNKGASEGEELAPPPTKSTIPEDVLKQLEERAEAKNEKADDLDEGY